MGDERPPRGKDRPSTAVCLSGRSRDPVIQENPEHAVTATHLETVLNDLQTRMAGVMEEQIKNNMLFFQVNPDQADVVQKITCCLRKVVQGQAGLLGRK